MIFNKRKKEWEEFRKQLFNHWNVTEDDELKAHKALSSKC